MLVHLAWMVGELPPEIIDRLMEKGGSFEVVRYARCVHKRVPTYEQEIAQSPQAIPYAIYVLKLEQKDIPAWITSMKEQQ